MSDAESEASGFAAEAEAAPKRRRIAMEEDEEEEDAASEAEEAMATAEQEPAPEDAEEGEGEDLMENMDADYQHIAALDNYDAAALDDADYGDMDAETRRRAEAENAARRDRSERLQGYLDDSGSEDDNAREERRRRFERSARDEGSGSESEGEEDPLNLETFDVPLKEWIHEERTRREIQRRFRDFLTSFKESGTQPLHEARIAAMCRQNLASLEVSYVHLSHEIPILGIWLADAPTDMLQLFDEVLTNLVLKRFPAYGDIQDELHVRISHLPIADKLRDLRQFHLDQLVRVSGVVTRRTGIFPQLKQVWYGCGRCAHVLGPFLQTSDSETRPTSCPACEGNGPFILNQHKTMYRNYQKVFLQESPGSVPPGRVPRTKDVVLLADLIDSARPGQEVEITGIYRCLGSRLRPEKTGFPVFSTLIEANHISKREDLFAAVSLTDDDKREINQLSRDPRIAHRLIQSIAPSIYGHLHMKTAIALSLFGGCPKDVKGKHRIRGDINVLLLGDPGTAKSQVLKYCEKTSPRAVYTTGKGASAVGLTAGVHRDPLTKEWTLEGGALVLADRGVCLIDEFDKMNSADQVSIHEAMEQQSISISKAGIVTSLQARCAVIAAANPIGGRYDASQTLTENVELTDPILQRFDILCVLQDVVDPVADARLADFVVGSHARSHPAMAGGGTEDAENQEDGATDTSDTDDGPAPLDQAMFRKYLMYARSAVRPQLHGIDQDKLARLYSELRRESMTSGGVPIAVRHIESVMRMAEAHARMHLRDVVREDDVDTAIRVMLESFIQAQKFSVRRALAKSFRKYLTHTRDYHELLLHALQLLVRDVQKYERFKYRGLREPDRVEVLCEDLEQKARECHIFDLHDFYHSTLFRRHHFTHDTARRVIVWTA